MIEVAQGMLLASLIVGSAVFGWHLMNEGDFSNQGFVILAVAVAAALVVLFWNPLSAAFLWSVGQLQ